MKKPQRKTAADDSITLDYDLFSLPTAQHKAGLAGLLLLIESMKLRRLSSLPTVMEATESGAKISFTKGSMQEVFDDLFAAAWVEVESRSRWQGKEPKRIIEKDVRQKDGATKKEKRFVYDAVQPSGNFLSAFYPADGDILLKLWRDMLWSTLRGKPTTRNVYEERAEGKHSSEGARTWKTIVKASKAHEKGKVNTEPIASSLFIGAQDVNAERVPFQGEAKQNFLLHFWAIPSLIFCPRRMKIEHRAEGGVGVSHEDAGYVLVVPEPSNLKDFLDDTRQLLRSLNPAIAGYRPKVALIDIPAEGGLEYLYHLLHKRLKNEEVHYNLAAVEIYHLEKQGNNIRTLAAERIVPDSRALRDYETLREQCGNTIYKSLRIGNLLEGRRWHERTDSAFNNNPWEVFVGVSGKTPANVRFFGTDVRKKFKAIEEELKLTKGDNPMSDDAKDDQLARRVYGLVQAYVRQKTERKSGRRYEDFKNNKDGNNKTIYPREYTVAQEKVCSDAFLAMRGRREQDFIEYFTGSICSVPQYLPEEDYVAVSDALIADWEKVKTLSMLALSACSWTTKSKQDDNEGGDK